MLYAKCILDPNIHDLLHDCEEVSEGFDPYYEKDGVTSSYG